MATILIILLLFSSFCGDTIKEKELKSHDSAPALIYDWEKDIRYGHKGEARFRGDENLVYDWKKDPRYRDEANRFQNKK